jgi:hypothetical protein
MNAKPMTGVDRALSFETVYYSAPMPRDPATLTILGAVFDKVYFPGVYLPKGGYDQAEWDREIKRIEELPPGGMGDREVMLAMMRFARHSKTLDGFCEFTAQRCGPLHGENVPNEALEDFYFAWHGRPKDPTWRPIFSTGYTKGIPGSDEFILYPGEYHYLFHAVGEAQRRGISVLNDRPAMIPMVPHASVETPTAFNDAKTISTMLAIECAKLALPEMPVLGPEELMEFRAENAGALRAYRRAMLQYAGELNNNLKDLSQTEIEQRTSFFVQTEIVPVLDALRGSIASPGRPWYRRWADGARVTAEVGAGFLTMSPTSAVANAVAKFAGLIATEVIAEGDLRSTLKQSGLYYLLKLEQTQSGR